MQVERCRLDTQRPDLKVEGAPAETRSWKRVSVALTAADQIHPSAIRPTLTCIGGTSIAQATGTCKHAQNFAFLTACLEPACTWGLTFSVVPFVTWSAFSYFRVPMQCCAFSHLCMNTPSKHPEKRDPRSGVVLGIPAPRKPNITCPPPLVRVGGVILHANVQLLLPMTLVLMVPARASWSRVDLGNLWNLGRAPSPAGRLRRST